MVRIFFEPKYPDICDQYLKDKSTCDIAKQLGSANSTIRAILIKCGINLRTNSESHQCKRPFEAMEKHPGWKGDRAKPKSGNQRARHLFDCPKGKERHHIDGNPLNNNPENITYVTRREHQILDGRLEQLNIIRAKGIEGRLRYCEQLKHKKLLESYAKLEAYKP